MFKSVLASVLVLALIISGCSAAAWVDVAIKDLPIVLQIVTSILSIADVAAIPQAQAVGAEAAQDLANLQKLLADYKSAQDANAQAAALVKVQAALEAVNSDLGLILQSIHVKDTSKQAAISAALGVAISVVVSVQALLPGSAPQVAKAVKLQSPKELKKAYNSAIAGAYPSAVLK